MSETTHDVLCMGRSCIDLYSNDIENAEVSQEAGLRSRHDWFSGPRRGTRMARATDPGRRPLLKGSVGGQRVYAVSRREAEN
jgi:hypothetical protein